MPKDILEENWIIFGYFGKELENFGKNKSQMRNRKKMRAYLCKAFRKIDFSVGITEFYQTLKGKQ